VILWEIDSQNLLEHGLQQVAEIPAHAIRELRIESIEFLGQVRVPACSLLKMACLLLKMACSLLKIACLLAHA